jgi:hypothetical protein
MFDGVVGSCEVVDIRDGLHVDGGKLLMHRIAGYDITTSLCHSWQSCASTKVYGTHQ